MYTRCWISCIYFFYFMNPSMKILLSPLSGHVLFNPNAFKFSVRFQDCYCHRLKLDGNVMDIWTVFVSLANYQHQVSCYRMRSHFLLKVDWPLRYYLAFYSSILYPYSLCEAQRSADQKIRGLMLLWICWRNQRRL